MTRRHRLLATSLAALLLSACAAEPAPTSDAVTPATGSPAPPATASPDPTAPTEPALTFTTPDTDVEVGVFSPEHDAPGSPVTVVVTAPGARGFDVRLGESPGTCVGDMWTHDAGTAQMCWVTLPQTPGEAVVTVRAALDEDGRYAQGEHTLTAEGVAGPGVDDATRDRILTCGNDTDEVWLTFDDWFTSPAAQDRLLDILAEHDVQARFFPTGQWARANPNQTRQLSEAGHLVENHTDTHTALDTADDATLESEIARGPDVDATLMRPGFGAGAFTQRVTDAAAAHGQRVCYWTVDTKDWSADMTAEDIVDAALTGNARTPPARPGGVVLFHMSGRHTAEALPAVIDGLRERGMALPALSR